MKVGDLVSVEIRSMFHEKHPPVIGTIVSMPKPEADQVRLRDRMIQVQVGNERRPRHIKDPERVTVIGQGSALVEIEEIWRQHREHGAAELKKREAKAAEEAEARKKAENA